MSRYIIHPGKATPTGAWVSASQIIKAHVLPPMVEVIIINDKNPEPFSPLPGDVHLRASDSPETMTPAQRKAKERDGYKAAGLVNLRVDRWVPKDKKSACSEAANLAIDEVLGK